MKSASLHYSLGIGTLGVVSLVVAVWVNSAAGRFDEYQGGEAQGDASQVALATAADEGYCSGQLRGILRRVLTSCGLVKPGGGRGCQPLEAKSVAALSGNDFNALFQPLAHRAAILQFEQDSAELDQAARALLEKSFSDQRGASYFFVVSRASPEGSVAHNRDLSQRRADAVLEHLKTTFNDPDLEQEVGLLWLGEEFAQLDQEFCRWTRSHPESRCSALELNRSAFIAWIDCRL
jgi:outer membrane protein OmpA-like peptidoglycan-associated protein